MDRHPVKFPSGYATAVAIGTADADGNIVMVDADNPLRVVVDGDSGGATPVQPAEPLSGSASTATVAGPYPATPGLPIIVTLSGNWTGSAKILRSVDGGATKVALTVAGTLWGQFTGNACEPVWTESEAGVTFYLELAPASGTIAYRIAQ